MKRISFMLVAGEPSGDHLAAELVKALRRESAQRETTFFGAGGQLMADAGVKLAFDMTQHAVVGLLEALKNYGKFKALLNQLLLLACEQKPEVIICVDFSGFNRRFAHAVKTKVRSGKFGDWNPRLVQYVSPQVWASRPGRALKMSRDYDLLLAIFPFEKSWYAEHVPNFPVTFVGHPLMERYATFQRAQKSSASPPNLVLLPGSRRAELTRHLPVMAGALEKILQKFPVAHRVILPNQNLLALAQSIAGSSLNFQIGGLAEALDKADLAIASTGTVTLECAYFGVPTIAIYKTSWSTYQIGKRIIQVKFLAMPNLLANEPVFPEFIQEAASAEALAQESLEFLRNPARRTIVRTKLAKIIESLGGPGASNRAAQAILKLLPAN